MEKRLLTEIANDIGNDNKSVDELIDTIMKNVEKWAKEHKGEFKKLTPEQRERLTQPTYLVRQIAEIEYAKENLRNIVYRNLKRAQGNLGEEERMLGLYDTLEKFNYSCPYSDTLLIGGEQPIHLEHIIPVTMGGPTDDWNCIPVCGSCNESKGNRHLLDWWNDNRTVEEEYKLVKIFEHMTGKLLDNSNQIRYIKTEDNTKHLDVITFLKQLLDHIEQNKQYILGPNTSILDDNTKAIESKLKELNKTFERVVKKNSDKTLKTDKQYFKEQKAMLKYVKGLGVSSYYKIAYNYFDEIQDMINQGIDEEEIRQFCFDRDDSFIFTLFYEKLLEYKEEFGNCLVPTAYICDDGYPLGEKIRSIRSENIKLNREKKQILTNIGFVWIVVGFDDDNIRVALKQFVEKFNSFVIAHGRCPIAYNTPKNQKEIDEARLYAKWKWYRNFKNLENEDEIIYVQISLIKPPMIRDVVKQFVTDFNDFVIKYKRAPNAYKNPKNKEEQNEKNLYARWRRYRQADGLENEDEIKYLKDNLIQPPNVREVVKQFVEEFNFWISGHNRIPNQRPQNATELENREEINLYAKWRRYRLAKNLNQDEQDYLKANGIDVIEEYIDTVRKEVKQFVADFNTFVIIKKRPPQSSSKKKPGQENKDELSLYKKWCKYRQAKNLNRDEQDYLKEHGIQVLGLEKMQETETKVDGGLGL